MIFHNNSPNLLHLVGLRMVSLRLKIEDFLDAVLGKDVVVPSDSFFEAQTPQQVAELIKRDVRIGGAAQDAR